MTPEQIKQALATLGLSQSDAAQMLGYSNAVRISELIHGKRNPSASVVRLLNAYIDGYRPHDWPQID